MAIRFRCNGCGRPFRVRDEMAGKLAQCRQCGLRIRVPAVAPPPPSPQPRPRPQPQPVAVPDSEPDIDAYGLDEPDDTPIIDLVPVSDARPPGGGWATRPTSRTPRRRTSSTSWTRVRKPIFVVSCCVALVIVVVVGVVVKQGMDFAPAFQLIVAAKEGQLPLDGPITVPPFPDPGPVREVEPGVLLREVVLGPPRMNPDAPPGHCGTLRVYLPAGRQPARSLPCVLITGAGTNMLTGGSLGDENLPEHLPYVRAGFAVIGFEQDGGVEDIRTIGTLPMISAAMQFLRARAGLVNAHIALEYALTAVPEVDPARVASAGHSSAGSMAVLFAENEPRLKACAAYAPALDLADDFGPDTAREIRKAGMGPLIDRFSPSNGIGTLRCPVYLFGAQDDDRVTIQELRTFTAAARARGKAVTLDEVPSGGHFQPMIDRGIPRAIVWLKQTLGPGAAAP